MFIILDRDGVINEDSENYIKSPQEWIPIPGSLEAIAQLKKNGHQVVIATNQSGIGRGLYTHETLALIHEQMNFSLAKKGVALDGIFYCPHHPDQGCECRKPKPGLFFEIAKQFRIDLSETICIGDSLRDIQAASVVGARPILVLTGNGRKTLEMTEINPISVYPDLFQAVQDLLK